MGVNDLKLVLAVINDEDSHKLTEKLANAGYMATKLASTGGFLKTGNTTIFVGVQKDKVEDVINIISEQCKTNKQLSLLNPPASSIAEGFVPYPIEVTVGGATIFVLDIDQFIKI